MAVPSLLLVRALHDGTFPGAGPSASLSSVMKVDPTLTEKTSLVNK